MSKVGKCALLNEPILYVIFAECISSAVLLPLLFIKTIHNELKHIYIGIALHKMMNDYDKLSITRHDTGKD